MSRKFASVASIATSIFLMLASAKVALATVNDELVDVPTTFTDVGIENGGIIILHTIYRSCDDECGVRKFIMVAPDNEVEALRAQFANEEDLRLIVRVRSDGRRMAFDAQIAACGSEHAFTAQILNSGESFYVVSEKYARERGWL